jgi:hypothetical protein
MGTGRVVKKSNDTVFVELYKQQPFKEKTEIDFSNIDRCGSVLQIWCYDNNIKNGDWEIVENIPVQSNYNMPNFWTQDALSGEYYHVKGTDNSYGESTDQVISETEAKNLVHMEL